MSFNNKIFDINDSQSFEEIAIELFHYQAAKSPVYKEYLKHIKVNANSIDTVTQIPFLPINLFKTHKIITGTNIAKHVFLSSGTTGSVKSKHYLTDISIYEESFMNGFEFFYGNIKDYCVLALLPDFVESSGSSLAYMVRNFIDRSCHKDSGFYLNNLEALVEKLQKLEKRDQKILLFGVSFALLDFIEQDFRNFHNFGSLIIMETGGMKGKHKEIVREELHKVLCDKLGVEKIHSEYGMTELLSQAYSKGEGLFKTHAWMNVLIRDINDPFTLIGNGKTGGINIIDLANRNSCAFIATDDLGKVYADGSFEVLGRFDNSDVRGCNLIL